MTYQEVLGSQCIALSISESLDAPVLGLSPLHLTDAMTEIARHLLALGARLAYGGDLRPGGFTELLFELAARHPRDADEHDKRAGIENYLAWPVHIRWPPDEVESIVKGLVGTANVFFLNVDGRPMSLEERKGHPERQPTEAEWRDGLTAMRRTMLHATSARVILGGNSAKFLGIMPGVAEEALLSLSNQQPLYIVGGFGGTSREVAEKLNLVEPWTQGNARSWELEQFGRFTASDLRNGLTLAENKTLAITPHMDEAVTLILRGMAARQKTVNI